MSIKDLVGDDGIVSGDDVVLAITVIDGDEPTDPRVNLTGCTATFVIARDNSRRILISKSTADDVVITDPAQGEIDVSIRSADTADLEGDFRYELQIVDTLGNRTTPLRGALEIAVDLDES